MYLTIKNWKLEDNWQLLDWIVKAKDWKYVISKYKKLRNEAQNKYYRAILGKVQEETGIDKDEIHEKMKRKFLDVPAIWNQLPYSKWTSSLTTWEFVEYVESVKNFFAEVIGMVIPSAEDRENFYQ